MREEGPLLLEVLTFTSPGSGYTSSIPSVPTLLDPVIGSLFTFIYISISVGWEMDVGWQMAMHFFPVMI